MSKEYLLNLCKDNREVLTSYDYYCLIAPNVWRVVNTVPLRRILLTSPEEIRSSVLSLRLGTGIIGELDCPSGDADYAPKGKNEVIVGIGENGIKALLLLGALPCISCHSGERLAQIAPQELNSSLGLGLEHANDTSFLISNYDARRLNWPKILRLGISPQRFYTRPGLTSSEVENISLMFKQANVSVPAIGYYDRSREDRFFQYA